VAKNLTLQGPHAVVRDDRGRIVTTAPLDVYKAPSKGTWRKLLKELTNNGEDLFKVLYDISQGTPYVVRHEGMVSEPIIPSPEARISATTTLLHMLHGKPVAQTEVVKSEVEAEEMQRYQAMSREELLRIAGLAGAEKKRLEAPSAEPAPEGADDDEG
jgi:hypothetical protein